MTAGAATSRRESAEGSLRIRIGRWPRSPVFYGIVVAVVAGVAGQWLHVSPPAAYGLCSACHGRDLVDWLLNHVEGAKLYVAAASRPRPATLPEITRSAPNTTQEETSMAATPFSRAVSRTST